MDREYQNSDSPIWLQLELITLLLKHGGPVKRHESMAYLNTSLYFYYDGEFTRYLRPLGPRILRGIGVYTFLSVGFYLIFKFLFIYINNYNVFSVFQCFKKYIPVVFYLHLIYELKVTLMTQYNYY